MKTWINRKIIEPIVVGLVLCVLHSVTSSEDCERHPVRSSVLTPMPFLPPVQKSYFLQDHTRCGNACVFGACVCGDQLMSDGDDGVEGWCCTTSNCTVHNLTVHDRSEFYGPKIVSCPGTMQPLTKKCNGKCNYYPDAEDHKDDERSYAPACGNASDECVEERLLCRSIDPLCQNKEDLR